MGRRPRVGELTPSQRRHVGMTLPVRVRDGIREGADVLGWSTGDWVLAAAAEYGPSLRAELGHLRLPRRRSVENSTFTALYMTQDERDELDDQATACGLNRSAFVTAVSRLAMGDDLEDVVESLRGAATAPADAT